MEREGTVFTIGTGGWEHEVFDHCFYPRPGMSSAEKLEFYSRYFSATEVRATFWDDRLTAKDAREWAEAVRGRSGFEFNLKLHSSFTHTRTIRPEASRGVRGMLQELSRHSRLGSLLIQFPYSFTNTGGNRYHLVRLAESFAGFPLHVEFRHESWHFSGLMNFLKENGLDIVSADIPRIRRYMPFMAGTAGDAAYLRLHGRNEKGWLLNGYDARYDYLYNTREIRELGKRLDALTPRCRKATVIANNSTGGKSIPLAFQLQAIVREGKPVPVPAESLNAFPFLRQVAQPETAEPLLLDTNIRSAV
jgi:uncharacterized protein YecE (DUF72 family)